MAQRGKMRDRPRQITLAAIEAVGSVAVATGLVAALDELAPITGLGVVYLLAVLFVAVRRGGPAAVVTALLSVAALNFFFLEPRYQLTISDSQNLVALAVFLVAALVVGRLAAAAREKAAEAEERARLAAAREREATLLAEAASSVLAGSDLETQLASMGAGLESSAATGLRIGFTSAPATSEGEFAFSLPTATRPGWLYGQPSAGWDRENLERIGPAVARLIDVAVERDRLGARSAEAEATRRADVAKTALLHAISHDFRSPLTAIATAAGGLRTGELSSEDRDALLSVIEGETQRLARLVEDLLDVSRIEAGAVHPRPDWCDLHDLVANAATQVRDRQGDHPVQLDLPGDLPLVRADAAQLERVFSNLLDNAIKFSPDGAPVQVSGGAGAGRVTVRVTDQGRGIPPSKRGQVFEPFFRGRDSGQGSGLGLAICRGLVEANGGEIRLQGDAPHGTTFAVSFPLVRQPLGAEEATR